MHGSTHSTDVKRHYLKIREDFDADPDLITYCKHATFPSYRAAEDARKEKLEEYKIRDATAIEVAFRR